MLYGSAGFPAAPSWSNLCTFVIQECEEWAKLPLELHSFPTVEALATRATEADLRAMGERPALIDSLVDTLRNESCLAFVM